MKKDSQDVKDDIGSVGMEDPARWEPYQLPEDWFEHEEDFYFPVNVPQINNLLGKLLTHVEAMGLSESAERANKDLIRQSLWTWFGDAQENSMTSYKNRIAPIELPRTPQNRII